jgi:hypothetical protein
MYMQIFTSSFESERYINIFLYSKYLSVAVLNDDTETQQCTSFPRQFPYIVLKRGVEVQKEDGAMFDTLPNPKVRVDLKCYRSIPDFYYIVSKTFLRV